MSTSKLSILLFASCLALLVSIKASANPDPTTQYVLSGKAVSPWKWSLNYGKSPIENGKASTVRSSLVAKPTSKSADGDTVRFSWKPKGVKNEWGGIDSNILTMNLTNTMRHTDLSSVINKAAIVFDVKVNKPPKEHVELMLESNWNHKTRAKFPLKNALKRLKKKKWYTIPVPLKCLDNGKLDFTKLTTIFSLKTVGKLDLEISNVQLTGLSGEVTCPT